MLKRRLQGVLRQYGPVVAFMTTDVLLGNDNLFAGTGGAIHRESVGNPDPVLYAFLLKRLGRWRECYVFHEDMLSADSDTVRRVEARVRARLAVVFERFLERGDWYECRNTPLMSGDELLEIFRDNAWREETWPPVVRNTDFFRSSTRDVVVPWVASLLNRYVKHREPLVRTKDVLFLTRAIANITDWANATHPALMGMSVLEAVDAQREWHEEMKHAATGQAVGKGEVVHRFPDRWTFERLTTAEQLSDEGASQGHCVGGTSYRNAVESGAMRIYSLRDPKGVPHVTVEIEQATSVPASPRVPAGGPTYWRLRQVKGRGNHRVSKPDLCKKLDTAFSLLGLGLTVKGSQWGGTADWDGCEPIVRPELYTDLDEDEPRRAENPVRSSWDDSMHAHRAYGRR